MTCRARDIVMTGSIAESAAPLQEVAAERERIAQMFDVPPHIHGEAEEWSRAAAARIREATNEPR